MALQQLRCLSVRRDEGARLKARSARSLSSSSPARPASRAAGHILPSVFGGYLLCCRHELNENTRLLRTSCRVRIHPSLVVSASAPLGDSLSSSLCSSFLNLTSSAWPQRFTARPHSHPYLIGPPSSSQSRAPPLSLLPPRFSRLAFDSADFPCSLPSALHPGVDPVSSKTSSPQPSTTTTLTSGCNLPPTNISILALPRPQSRR